MDPKSSRKLDGEIAKVGRLLFWLLAGAYFVIACYPDQWTAAAAAMGCGWFASGTLDR